MRIKPISDRLVASLVFFVSSVFAFYFLPKAFMDPRNVSWVFSSTDHLTDGSGHAIQAMFYAVDSWHWPIGLITNFGGEVGASLILAAVSPLFAVPFKLLVQQNLLDYQYQFIGLQSFLGITFTAVSVFYLSRAFKVSRIGSFLVALISIGLPTLFVDAIFNESLSWQFLAIIPIILVIRDLDRNRISSVWFVLLPVCVLINTYYVPIALFFFLISILNLVKLSFIAKRISVLYLMAMTFLVSFLHYCVGGFEVPIGRMGSSLETMDAYSVRLGDFFQKIYDHQGYVFRGTVTYTILGLYAASSMLLLVKGRMSRERLPVFSDIRLQLISISFALFLISLGPLFWANLLEIPMVSNSIFEIIAIFRAVGRFSWPFIYLVLVVCGLCFDSLIKRLKLQQVTSCLLVFAVLVFHFADMRSEIERFKSVGLGEVNMVSQFNASNLTNLNAIKSVEFLPAFDYMDGSPWREVSAIALRGGMSIQTFQWLGRANADELMRIELQQKERLSDCRMDLDHLFVVRNTYLKSLEVCNYKLELLATSGEWQVLRIYKK